MITFDVILPAHNAADTIDACLASVHRQTLHPQRILVVADRCADDTALRARRLGAEVLEIDAGQVAVARNVAIREASARYLAFLDADDEWHASWLANAAAAIDARPDAGLFFGGVEEIDAQGRVVRVAPARSPGDDVLRALLLENFIPTSATVARRDDVCRAGAFDESLRNASDWDLWLRLAQRASVCAVAGLHARYHRKSGSVSRAPERLLWARDDALRVIQRVLASDARLRPWQDEAQASVLAFSAMRLLSQGAPDFARIDVEAALRIRPGDPTLWALLAASLLPSALRRRAQAWRHAWRAAQGTRTSGA